MRRMRLPWLLLALTVFLCACGEAGSSAAAGSPVPAIEAQSDKALPRISFSGDSTGTPYSAPPFQDSGFHSEKAEGNETVRLDLSAVDEGYVAVSARSAKRLKFQVLYEDLTYNYDIASDGTPSVLPLQSGNGMYQFRVMENVTEKKYAEIYSSQCDVKLKDEFQPFLRPSDYVAYTADSKCVAKAKEIAKTAGDQVGMVAGVYNYVCSSVSYDREKAASVQSGYLPVPDETMATGTGICFDYAALAAAMLRSQGIPTKLVFGYVSPDDLYHAWNMFYTDATGWVTVEFQVSGPSWTRLDLTFAASGADSDFIGDGSNYTDLYFY